MKRVMIAMLLAAVVFNTTACGFEDMKATYNKEIHPNPEDISTWVIPDGARFVPVDFYSVRDGTVIGTTFVTYVDLENGCMYMYTGQYQSGYGTTFTKLTDEDNEACIYEDLDTLRKEYGYSGDPQKNPKRTESEQMSKAKMLYDTASDVL